MKANKGQNRRKRRNDYVGYVVSVILDSVLP